jgi:hypothetical protein
VCLTDRVVGLLSDLSMGLRLNRGDLGTSVVVGQVAGFKRDRTIVIVWMRSMRLFVVCVGGIQH